MLKNENSKHFIRGLIDGDDWVRNYCIDLCGTEKTIDQVCNYLINNIKLEINDGKIKQQKETLGYIIFLKNKLYLNIAQDNKDIIKYMSIFIEIVIYFLRIKEIKLNNSVIRKISLYYHFSDI